MNILKRLYLAATLKEPEWWRQLSVIPTTASGQVVTPENALQIVAVYACVRILSETSGSLGFNLYKNTKNGREQVEHPLNNLLNVSPNGEQTAFELREYIMASLCLRGNAYAHITRSRGQVVSIEPLNAKYMQVSRGLDGKLLFDYQDTENPRVFKQDEIWRIAGIGSNGVTGLSPISLMRESLGLSLAAENQAAKLFQSGAKIPGVLEFPGVLKKEQVENLREQIADSSSSVKPLILESGMKYSQIGMSAGDAQLIESRKFSVTDVCRIFRVPPHMVGDMERSTFSNIEHQGIEFVVHTLRPWLVRIEQTIARDLLTQSERQTLTPAFNVDALLRGDIKSRYEAYEKGINAGFLTRNEARRHEKLNDIDGLDDPLTPLNMATETEREQRLTDNAVNMLSSKEIKAINVELERLSPDDFKDWAGKFYQRFSSVIVDALCCTDAQSSRYVDKRVAAITKDPVVAVPYILKNCKDELRSILDE